MKAYLTSQGIRFVGVMGFQAEKPTGTFEKLLDDLRASRLQNGERIYVESADQCIVYHNITDAAATKLLMDNGIPVNMAENDPSISR
jgi:hypothetical protein